MVGDTQTIKTEGDQEVCDKEKAGSTLTCNLSFGLKQTCSFKAMPSTGPGSSFTTKSESTISNLDTGLRIQAQVAVGSRQQGHGEVGAGGEWGEEKKDNLCFSFDCPHKAKGRSCVI